MPTINNFNSLPAQFVEVQSPQNDEPFSRGKLKVFYVGKTADFRVFPEEFANNAIKTLKYTPIVAHYDSDKGDFTAHAENQEIYGLVDPTVEPEIVEDDNGTKWCICDTIIYDKRPDKTGDIASKILGHAESLELNPDSVKYEIIRDDKGRFSEMKFLDGSFSGVSVVGNDEDPAFPGASFFTKLDSTNFRGKEMSVKIPDFVKLSWGEKGNYIFNALAKVDTEFAYILDIYDKFVVYNDYYVDTHEYKTFKREYTLKGQDVTLSDTAVQVHASYEEFTTKKPETKENVAPAALSAPAVNATKADVTPAAPSAPAVNATVEATPASTVTEAKPAVTTEPAPVPSTNATLAPEATAETKPAAPTAEPVAPVANATTIGDASAAIIAKGATSVSTNATLAISPDSSTKDNPAPTGEKINENTTTATALSEAERAELAKYRKKEKIEIIDSFKDLVDEAELKKLLDSVDTFTKEDLTNKLNSLTVSFLRNHAGQFNSLNKKGLRWIPDNDNNTDTANDAEKVAYVRELLK